MRFPCEIEEDEVNGATATAHADSPLKAGEAGDSIVHPAACASAPLLVTGSPRRRPDRQSSNPISTMSHSSPLWRRICLMRRPSSTNPYLR